MFLFILNLFKKKYNLYCNIKFIFFLQNKIFTDILFCFFYIKHIKLNKVIYNLLYYFLCINRYYFKKKIFNNIFFIKIYFRIYLKFNIKYVFKKYRIYNLHNIQYLNKIDKYYLNFLFLKSKFCNCVDYYYKNKIIFLFLRYELLNILNFFNLCFYFVFRNFFICSFYSYINKFFLKFIFLFLNIFIRVASFFIKYNNSFLFKSIDDIFVISEYKYILNNCIFKIFTFSKYYLIIHKYTKILNIMMDKNKPWILIKNKNTKFLSLSFLTSVTNLFLFLLLIIKVFIPRLFYFIKIILSINFINKILFKPFIGNKFKGFYFLFKNLIIYKL